MPRRRPRIAPLRLRVLAALIDIGVVVGALVVAIGLVLLGARRPELARLGRRAARRLGWSVAGNGPPRLRPRLRRRLQIILFACGVAEAALRRDRRSVGQRTVGLRKVELRTGRSAGPRARVIHFLGSHAWRRVLDLAFRPLDRRRKRRLAALQGELQDIARQYSDDDEARREAQLRLYKEQRISSSISCLPILAKLAVAQAPIFLTKRHQSVADLVAGVVVVEERASRSRKA